MARTGVNAISVAILLATNIVVCDIAGPPEMAYIYVYSPLSFSVLIYT